MKKPPKAHLIDSEHENHIPSWDENKLNGFKATICGYQRKNVTSDPRNVNCELCLKEMQKRNI